MSGDETESQGKTNSNNKAKPLNITILLDLSNRVLRPKGLQDSYNQRMKDSIILMAIQSKFYDYKYEFGRLRFTPDMINVVCYPYPNDQDINRIVTDMEVNTAIKTKADIPIVHQKLKDMKSIWNRGINQIYQRTIEDKQWVGSDIWGFFNYQADVECIKKDFRNIVIILTDGYIEHINNWRKTGPNEYTGISSKTINNQTAITPVKNKYNNLEILFLEINPLPNTPPNEFDKIEKLIKDWCNNMEAKQVDVVRTDMPKTTQKYINKFIGW